MPKTTKKRAKVKTLSRKKKLTAAQMKKVKGGQVYAQVRDVSKSITDGLLVPAVQKVRE